MKKKEKEAEATLKNYRRKYAQRNPKWANKKERDAKMKDKKNIPHLSYGNEFGRL